MKLLFRLLTFLWLITNGVGPVSKVRDEKGRVIILSIPNMPPTIKILSIGTDKFKQCRPRSDGSLRSSLIQVYTVSPFNLHLKD